MRLRTEELVPTDEARRLWFFENLDRIHRALRQPELEDALRAAFDVVLDVFDCDRVWLSYPCDCDAPSLRIVLEHTRRDWPGAFASGAELTATPELVDVHRALLAQDGPLTFGAGAARPLPPSATAYGARAATMMVVDPRVDRPYVFGLHRCRIARSCSEDELRLFREIGRRLGDALATMLVMRDLRDREAQLERAGRIAQVGHWNRDLQRGEVTLSPETCRIFEVPPSQRVQCVGPWNEWLLSRVHPDDRARLTATLEASLARGARYDIEYRIIDARGAVRLVHSRAEIVLGTDDRAERMFGTIQDITDHRRTEERLVASEALYRAVIDHATDALFLHGEDGRVEDVNQQACESLGYTREELLGLAPADFDADFSPEFTTWLVPKLRSNESVAFDSRHRRKDGTIFPVEVRMRSFQLGERTMSVALARDISDRERVHQELRASEERFRELAETIAEVFWVTDPRKNSMLYISPGYERIWGRTCESLYASPRSWLDAIHPDDRARVIDAATTKQARGTYDEEYRIVRPDGEIRWIRDAAFPVHDAGGRVQRVVGVARDVTERRSLQEQLLHAQKMEAIGQLAGGVAHDFNNLLGALLMEAELAEELPDLPADARGALAEIKTAGKRAAALTRQLLLFGRRQAMHPRAHDVNTLVADLAKMLQRIIGEDIRLDLRLAPAALVVLADGGMLEQVLVNLAINARDAMPRGGTLTITTGVQSFDEASASRVAGAQPGRYAQLAVTDSGHGIAPEILPRIFEPFFTTKPPGRGTGLGLATAFGILKEHGGWIAVQSTPGCGATFEVYLPLHGGAGATREAATVPVHGRNETILLVEDEPQLRRGTRRALERHGYRVLEAESGVEALRLWPEIRGSVSLLLTDVVMPGGVDGIELASRLRASRPQLVVVFASGYARGGQVQGGERFLEKPVTSAQLLETIRDALDRT